MHHLIDDRPVGFAQIVILAVCFLLQMIDGYDVLSISYAAPSLAADWQLSPEQLGVVFSAGMVGMTLGAMFLAPITDSIGRRTMIFWATLIMGLSMLATAWAGSIGTVVILRVITGLTIGAILASLTALVSEFFPDRYRNLAVGILICGYPLGAVLGGFLAAALIPEFGWRGIFVAGGIMTLAIVPLIGFLVPESLQYLIQRRPANTLAKVNSVLKRLRLAGVEQLPEVEAEPEKASVSSLLVKSRRGSTLLLWLSFFFCFLTLYFLVSWIPKLLVDAGFPLELAIYAGIAFNLGGALGNVSIGWTSARFGLRKTILYFHLIAAVGMVMFVAVPLESRLLLALTIVIGLFQLGGFTGFYIMAARLYPAEIRTTGIGWGIGIGRFGAVISPVAAGLLIGAGWGIVELFKLFAVPLAFAGWFAYRIRVKP